MCCHRYLQTMLTSSLITLIFTLPLLVTLSEAAAIYRNRATNSRGCAPVTVSMCSDFGYNETYFPNSFDHETQNEAEKEMDDFRPLIDANCYEHMALFLCAMYVPPCLENYVKEVKPCREFCVEAKNECGSLMDSLGFNWPERLDCNQLPEQDEMLNELVCAAAPSAEL